MTSDAMESEFNTVAGWTEDAVRELGPGCAVPAGCRGSGSPSSLAWLASRMDLDPATRLLDAGAGVGGPAAWLTEQVGMRPVCAEPMAEAAAASRRLFGLPAVVAWSQCLPFQDRSFDAAWCLGVLCTTEDKAGLLAELRRVLRAGARLGLLVFVAEDPDAAAREGPDGNDFPQREELHRLLAQAGFSVRDSAHAADLPETPADWQERTDRVEALMAQRHGQDPRWRRAEDQSARMGDLLSRGILRAILLHATAPT